MSESKSVFKKYYADPEFRERHKKYMNEKVKCDCGLMVPRSYLSKHKRTQKHTIRMLEKENRKLRKKI